MKASRSRLSAIAALAVVALGLSACSSTAAEESSPTADASGVVTIEDNHGSVEVPVNPERVVALDNTIYATLTAWDIDLVAAPKGVLGNVWTKYVDDPAVLDVGSHREPDFEKIVEADPDLVIGGYRFAQYYDEIKALLPDVPVIEIEPRTDQDVASELKRQTEILGQIFDRESDATAITERLDTAIADAKAAYNGTDTVMALIISGGEIGYVAPVTGRSLGTLYPTLGLVPAIAQEAEDTSHGDDISLEAIAASNPDWFIVLDREGGFGEEGYIPALDVLRNAEAIQNVTAIQEGRVITASPTFYLDEGIESYTQLYEDTATAFAAAS